MNSQKAIITPVTQELDQKHIPYRVFQHPGQVHSLEQAARERGQRPEQVIRSLLFRLPGDEFIMVLVAGPAQLSWAKLREFLSTNRMTMATPEEVDRLTGYPTGAVSPFGLPRPLRILMDQGALLEDEISIGSGIRNTTIILSKMDLLQALPGVEIGNFIE